MKQKKKDYKLMTTPIIYTDDELRKMRGQTLEEAYDNYVGYLLTRGVSEEASLCFAKLAVIVFIELITETRNKNKKKNGRN